MEKKISRVGVGGCFATNEVLDYADSHNIKLIDLGWGYQGPNKFEKQFGEWFKDKKREDYFIVDKLPLFNGLYTDTYHKSLYLILGQMMSIKKKLFHYRHVLGMME